MQDIFCCIRSDFLSGGRRLFQPLGTIPEPTRFARQTSESTVTSPVSLHKSFGDYPGKVRAPNRGVEIVGLRERSDCQVEASEARTMLEGSFLP